MKNGGLQRTWVRILLTVLTAAVMVMVFFFSMETAEESDETSGRITRQVIGVLYPDYADYPETQQQEVYDSIQLAVRKTAHYSEYTLLGFLMRLCLESWFGKRRWLTPVSWAACTLYASTDEIHQLLIDGRSGQWTDVLLDSTGVLSGVLIALLFLALIRKRRSRKGAEEACP